MAKQDPGEYIDPVYKYIDDKIKPIKSRLKQLTEAHDAVATQQKQELLLTQRHLADFIIASTFSMCSLITPPINESILAKLAIRASGATAKVDSSDNPLPIANEFYKEYLATLEKLGFKTTTLG